MKTPARLSLLGIGVAALAVAGLASPAAAAGTRTLPDDNSLYGVTCPYYSDATAQTPSNQVITIDEQTAEATAIGSGTEIEGTNCAGSATLDPTTGTYYGLAAVGNDSFSILVTVDLATGVSTKVADITLFDISADLQSMAIGLDGSAYGLSGGELFSINLSDGTLTPVGLSVPDVHGFVSDPVTGLFYAVDNYGYLYEITVADGNYSGIGQLPFISDQEVYALTMDTNGVFWMERDVETSDEYQAELWSFTLVDPVGSGELAGVITLGAIAPYAMSLAVGPAYVAPALANTGVNTEVPLGTAVVVLVIGAALLTVARRRVRTN